MVWTFGQHAPAWVDLRCMQMADVVAECTAFLDGHLSEVLQLPVDLACLPEDLLSQLAKVCFIGRRALVLSTARA